MQNHDELTYELVHWSHGHNDDLYPYRGGEIAGGDLGDSVRQDLCHHLTGDGAPYNLVFTTNGIACTTATVIAAALSISDLAAVDDEAIAASSGLTCCWRCTTHCNRESSRCPAGTCAAC